MQHANTLIKQRKNFFPYELMYALSSPAFSDSITWTHDGKSFFFLNYDEFAQKYNNIIRGRTGTIRYATFRRRLNRWGFRMNPQQDPNRGAFFHDLFQKDDPNLCGSIVYNEVSQTIPKESETTDGIHDNDEHTDNLTNIQSPSHAMEINVEDREHLGRMIAIEESILHVNILIRKRLQEMHRPVNDELSIYGFTYPFNFQEYNTRFIPDNEYLFAFTHSQRPYR